MICQKCKNALNPEYRFCPYCGKSVSADNLDLTLGEVYDLWRGEHFPTISSSTVRGYEAAWKRLESLSSQRITELKAMHYQTIVQTMVKEKYSRSAIEKVRILISQLCSYAMKNDILSKNYARFLCLPKKEKTNRNRFSDEELSILWKHSDLPVVRIILILAYTGLRPNELFTLKRENVFLDKSVPYLVGGSKTDAGKNRTVVISPLILDFVKTLYNMNGEYLISSQRSNMVNLNSWRKRQYYPTLERLNLPKREIHCLRHTFASMMVKAGANQKSLTELMGHTNINTTADIYAHVDLKQLADAILLLEKPS